MIGEIIISLFLVVGGTFTFLGSVGLHRLPDFYSRLHGPTKATTLGIGSFICASMLSFKLGDGSSGIEEVLIMLFLFLTAPISAHMLARTGLHLDVPSVAPPAPADRAEAAEASEGQAQLV